jgi:hypothetical protein
MSVGREIQSLKDRLVALGQSEIDLKARVRFQGILIDNLRESMGQVAQQRDQLARLAKWLFEAATSDGCDVDGGDVQDQMVKLGFVVSVPYDPAVHGEIDSDPGDMVYVLAPEWKTMMGED